MQTIGKQLVISISLLISSSFYIYCQNDTIFYKGIVALEMQNGTKQSFFFDGEDGLLRWEYAIMIEIDSCTMKPSYSDSTLLFKYRGNLDSLIEYNSYSFDLGNLLIIKNIKLSNGETNIESCFFYLLFEVELYYIDIDKTSLIVPNLYKRKRKESNYKIVSVSERKIVKIIQFVPFISDSVQRLFNVH